MQKKAITSEKNATAIARDKLTGRLGRDCFPVLPPPSYAGWYADIDRGGAA